MITKRIVKKVGAVRTPTMFRSMILSRHPSHRCLRAQYKNLPLSKYRSVIRFGSTTEVEDTIAKGGKRIEINSVQSIKNSSCKLLMKQCFERAGVKTAPRYINGDFTNWKNENYPIVAKNHFGSKGSGNTLIKNEQEFEAWQRGKTISHYIFEKFVNYGHEFRLHVSENGCFYTCRKALKSDCPEDQKWRHHDDTSVWLLETNENFHKPNSWNDIVRDCVSALNAIGADVLSFDVKVQTPTTNGLRRPYQDYILIECNSASSMDNGTGELSICAQKYIEEIPKILEIKINQLNR